MSILSKSLSCLGALILTLFLPGAAAQAASYRITDPTGDVSYYGGTPSAALKAQSDLVAVSYGHSGTSRFSVTWRVRDLRSSLRVPSFRLRESEASGTPVLSLNWNPGSRPFVSVTRADGTGRTCRSDRSASVNYTKNRVTVSFPRSCFGRGQRLTHPYASTFGGTRTVHVSNHTEDGHSITPRP